jgi:cytochrome c oxidase subunit 2
MMGWLPENVSTFGGDIDRIFYLIYYITGAVFVLVTVLLASALILFRQREGRRAVYSHGNAALELTWTIVPAIILVVLAFLSQATWARVKGQVPPARVHVEVTGKQFNWEIVYPGPDGAFGTADDLKLDNELHVPVNQVVRVTLKAREVIHSFFVPQFRLKQDAVPGRAIDAWFEATKPGRYELPCAELCGFGHSGMKGWVTVHTPEEYQQWVKAQWPSS